MTRLATHWLKTAAGVALALSLGTALWAQGHVANPVKPAPAHRAHWTAAAKPPVKATERRRSAAERKLHRASVAKAVPKQGARIEAASVATADTAPVAPATSAPAATDPMIDLAGKRDPFVALVNNAKGGGEHLPPGKAGLVIGTLIVQGTVQGANGMIAVVANPDQRVYFVREGDRLYDGDVEKISLDGVTFQQNTKDAFGKPIERTVVKRIYPSAGEQQ